MWRRRSQRDFEEEVQAHLALEAEQLEREGLSADDAIHAARRRFGNVTRSYDRFQESSRWRWLGELARDGRVAIRALRRLPTFVITATVALALGIGATTAMLSVVRAVLLSPLPYADANRLVVALHNGNNPVAPANFIDWRAQTRSFTDMAAAEYWTPDLTGDDDPTQINALHITSGMLPMLGVAPIMGRTFGAEEEHAGNDHVAVVSYGLWQRRFAGRRDIVGQPIALDGNVYTIIGVMPQSFQFAPFWATHAELWAPLSLDARAADRNGQSLRIFARLRPGVTLAQARADLGAVTSRLEQQHPGTNQNVEIVPLRDKVVRSIQTPLLVLLVAVVFVLLIACSNVAHMLLARAATRQREMALRTALGASRGRLIAQMLVESMLLALIGGAAGCALAMWSVRALVAKAPAIIPRVANVHVDGTILLATLGITVVTAIAFGLLPALQVSRVDLAETFRDGDRASSEGRARSRVRAMLVASEFALALVLLVGAGLMIRSFVALQHIDPGFDPRNVLSMVVATRRTADTSQSPERFFQDALARVRAVPGVASASYINHLPIAGDEWRFSFHVDGRPKEKPGESPAATYRVVFPGYFATMKIPMLQGRDIETSDRADAPHVVVINRFMADRYWPNGAIGQRMTLGDSTLFTIVGVVQNDVRSQWSAAPAEEAFIPFAQQAPSRSATARRAQMTLVARVACESGECDASRLAPSIRAAVRSVDRATPISNVQTMGSVVNGATGEQRFYLILLAAFATIAVVLAAVGIYGVMSYSVSRRTHEIGIRIALGAPVSSVMRDVVGSAVTLAVIGAGAGLVLALPLTRTMQSILYGVGPTDVMTFVIVTVLLLLIALVASIIPARRAANADPLMALRAD